MQRSVLETLYIEISYRDLAQGYPTAMLPKAFLESLYRDLVETLYRDLLHRSCHEVPYRDFAKGSLIESLNRNLLNKISCKDLAWRSLIEILYRDRF